jgi:hypothetical protein
MRSRRLRSVFVLVGIVWSVSFSLLAWTLVHTVVLTCISLARYYPTVGVLYRFLLARHFILHSDFWSRKSYSLNDGGGG